MRRHVGTVLLGLLGGFLCFATVTSAAENQPVEPYQEPTPPFTDVRVITEDMSSSACIGETSTPVCAVETWLACPVRGLEKYCDRFQIWAPLKHPTSDGEPNNPASQPVFYRIEGVSETKPAWSDRQGTKAPPEKPTCTLIDATLFWPNEVDQDTSFETYEFHLIPAGQGWDVIYTAAIGLAHQNVGCFSMEKTW